MHKQLTNNQMNYGRNIPQSVVSTVSTYFACGKACLTHWDRNKMTTILRTTYLYKSSCKKRVAFWFKCDQDFVFVVSWRDQFNNKLAMVQIMACRRTGDKQLSEPKSGQFIDLYRRHWASMVWMWWRCSGDILRQFVTERWFTLRIEMNISLSVAPFTNMV